MNRISFLLLTTALSFPAMYGAASSPDDYIEKGEPRRLAAPSFDELSRTSQELMKRCSQHSITENDVPHSYQILKLGVNGFSDLSLQELLHHSSHLRQTLNKGWKESSQDEFTQNMNRDFQTILEGIRSKGNSYAAQTQTILNLQTEVSKPDVTLLMIHLHTMMQLHTDIKIIRDAMGNLYKSLFEQRQRITTARIELQKLTAQDQAQNIKEQTLNQIDSHNKWLESLNKATNSIEKVVRRLMPYPQCVRSTQPFSYDEFDLNMSDESPKELKLLKESIDHFFKSSLNTRLGTYALHIGTLKGDTFTSLLHDESKAYLSALLPVMAASSQGETQASSGSWFTLGWGFPFWGTSSSTPAQEAKTSPQTEPTEPQDPKKKLNLKASPETAGSTHGVPGGLFSPTTHHKRRTSPHGSTSSSPREETHTSPLSAMPNAEAAKVPITFNGPNILSAPPLPIFVTYPSLDEMKSLQKERFKLQIII